MQQIDDHMLIMQVTGGNTGDDESPGNQKPNDNGEVETLQPSGGGSEQTPVYGGSGPNSHVSY